MRWRAITAALLTGGLLLVPASAAAADDGRPFVFRSPSITESSGLVDLGGVMVTTNDSGNPSVLFTVSPVSGKTVGVTDFHTGTQDVEALAPGGRGRVWVGDIGDNEGKRKSISVLRVRVGFGRIEAHPTVYRLAYPSGRHDAESLVRDRQGRLYVITKSVKGGTVYRAPLVLSSKRVNRLQAAGHVIEYATDAAMLPSGRHVIVRGPERASVYTFPAFKYIGSFVLPRQRQGEGISVGPGRRIRLSSEGVRSPVREVVMPAALVRRMQPPAPPTPSPSPSARPTPSPSNTPSPSESASPSRGEATSRPSANGARQADGIDPWLIWSIPAVIVLGAAGIGFGLRRRSE